MTRVSHWLPLLAILAGCSSPDFQGSDVALAGEGAGNPTVALGNATGTAFAAWIGTTESGSNVYIARIDSSGRSAPVRVNDIDGDAAPHDQAPPQVAVAPDGTIHVVWQNNTVVPGRRFPSSNLRFARSTNGGHSFEPAIFVNDDALGGPSSHTFQDMAVADNGTVYVSWIDGRARSSADATAGEHDMHGHSSHMPGSDVRVAKSTDGGLTFTSGVVVHRDVCPCCRTSLATGDDGAVAVAFRSATDNIRDILVVRSSDGGDTFSEPVRVHADGWRVDACPHAGASLAFADDGRIHIAWYTGAEARQGLWYARSNSDASFDQPVPLQTGDWVPVSQVKLAVADDGVVWIAWDDRRKEASAIKLATARAGEVTPVPVGIHGRSPAVAAEQIVVVGWQHDSGAAVRVQQAR